MRSQSPLLKLLANHIEWIQRDRESKHLRAEAYRRHLTSTRDHLKTAEEVAILLSKPQDCQYCGRRSSGMTLTEENNSAANAETLEQFKQVSSSEQARRAEVMSANAGFSYEDAGSISIINQRGNA